MDEIFIFKRDSFLRSLFINFSVQLLFFAGLIILFARTFETKILYALVFSAMLIYMLKLNLSYNPTKVEFEGTDIKIYRLNILLREYESVYDANKMLKTTISKRDENLHSVIFLNQFTDNKAMPIKIHLKHIEKAKAFTDFLERNFRNIHKAEIKR